MTPESGPAPRPHATRYLFHQCRAHPHRPRSRSTSCRASSGARDGASMHRARSASAASSSASAGSCSRQRRRTMSALTKELRTRAKQPLLIAATMERGAGQALIGATGLPPLAAIASLGDADAVRKAARLTAREARTLGVTWALAPVLDLDLNPENPIVGSREFGSDPALVATLGSAWIE